MCEVDRETEDGQVELVHGLEEPSELSMTVGEGDTGLVFLNGKDILSLKTEELKAELNKRGLKKSGNKCTLVERLRAAMISEHTVKCRKISPGAYIFQRPFLRGLFLEGLIFGGAYLRKEICLSKSIGLAL